MAEKVITYKVKVVNESGQIVDKLATNFTELKKSVGDLENELQNTDFGSEQFKELQKELKNSKGALEEAQQSTMSLGEKFGSLPGFVGQAAQSVMGLQKAFMLLIANPIGAVIAALGVAFTAVYKAITSTEEGTFKLKQLMGALSGVLDPVLKLFSELGVILIDNVLAGLEAVQKALKFLGFDQFAKASEDGQKLAKTLTDIEEKEGDLAVERAKQNKELAEAREILSDTNLTIGERQRALDKVRKSEEDLAKRETDLAQQRVNAIRSEMNMRGKSKELLDAEEKALTQLYGQQQNAAAIRRKNVKAQQALDREVSAERKADEKEAADAVKTAAKNEEDYIKLKKQLTLGAIEELRQREIQAAEDAKQQQNKAIDLLEISEEKKAELRVLNEQATKQKIADINKKFDDEEKKKQEEKDKEVYDKSVELNNSLIELDQMKYERLTEITDEDINRTIELLKEKTRLLLENENLTAEQRLLIEQQLQNSITKVQEDAEKRNWDIRKRQLQATADAFGDIAELAGETTMVGKTASIAQATINAYLSATEAYKATVGIPVVGPVVAPIAAAAAVAAGLKAVSQIMATKTTVPGVSKPKFAGGGIVEGMGSISGDMVPAYLSPGEAVINARSTSMFRPLLDLVNQSGGGNRFSPNIQSNGVDMTSMALISTIKGQKQQPIQAFVVDKQMTNQAMLSRAVKSRSLI
jgi:hypothetical protein